MYTSSYSVSYYFACNPIRIDHADRVWYTIFFNNTKPLPWGPRLPSRNLKHPEAWVILDLFTMELTYEQLSRFLGSILLAWFNFNPSTPSEVSEEISYPIPVLPPIRLYLNTIRHINSERHICSHSYFKTIKRVDIGPCLYLSKHISLRKAIFIQSFSLGHNLKRTNVYIKYLF